MMINENDNKDGIHGVPLVTGAAVSFGCGWLLVSFFRWIWVTCWPWMKRHPIATGILLAMFYIGGTIGEHWNTDQAVKDSIIGGLELIILMGVVIITNLTSD